MINLDIVKDILLLFCSTLLLILSYKARRLQQVQESIEHDLDLLRDIDFDIIKYLTLMNNMNKKKRVIKRKKK